MTKAKPGLSFEQIMLSEVPNATYGELLDFSKELANRIADNKSFDKEIDAELIAAVLHEWATNLEKPSND